MWVFTLTYRGVCCLKTERRTATRMGCSIGARKIQNLGALILGAPARESAGKLGLNERHRDPLASRLARACVGVEGTFTCSIDVACLFDQMPAIQA